MAPKNKDTGKGKGKAKGKDKDNAEESSGAGKLKAAQSINVRHILVMGISLQFNDSVPEV